MGCLRQINTCRKVPVQINFFRWRHLTFDDIAFFESYLAKLKDEFGNYVKYSIIQALKAWSFVELCYFFQIKNRERTAGRFSLWGGEAGWGAQLPDSSQKIQEKRAQKVVVVFQEIIADLKWLEWQAYLRAAFDLKEGICYENLFCFKQCCGFVIDPEPRILKGAQAWPSWVWFFLHKADPYG